jgi:MOSC domain-containing protein YiiM
MEDPSFVRRFRAAERPGLYCRVIREGDVQEGDEVFHEPHSGPTVGALEAFRDAFDPDPNETTIRRHLAAPIDIRSRAEYEQRLQALLATREG